MLRILFILILVAVYYFSNITYKLDMSSTEQRFKESNSWGFVLVKDEEQKNEYYLNWYATFGVQHPVKDNTSKATMIEFSYIKK